MVYLHENREEFTNAVNLASEYFHILPIIAEKDYYVTMILRELSERQDFIVFKGGTSLSKKSHWGQTPLNTDKENKPGLKVL